MRIIQLPPMTPNLQIVDEIDQINQTVIITIKSLDGGIKTTVADITNGVDTFFSSSCACGANLNNSPSSIPRYYFFWNNAAEYPMYKNFGVVDINDASLFYTKSDRDRNVILVVTEVNLWNYFDDTSNANRELFFDAIGFDRSKLKKLRGF